MTNESSQEDTKNQVAQYMNTKADELATHGSIEDSSLKITPYAPQSLGDLLESWTPDDLNPSSVYTNWYNPVWMTQNPQTLLDTTASNITLDFETVQKILDLLAAIEALPDDNPLKQMFNLTRAQNTITEEDK